MSIHIKTTILGSTKRKTNSTHVVDCLGEEVGLDKAEKITMLAPGEPLREDHFITEGPPLKRPSPLLLPSELPSEYALGGGP